MGVYNMYGKLQVQLKIAEYLNLFNFREGHTCDLPDGVYCGLEGIVVVAKRRVHTFSYEQVKSKWGTDVQLKRIIEDMNPVKKIIEQVKQEVSKEQNETMINEQPT